MTSEGADKKTFERISVAWRMCKLSFSLGDDAEEMGEKGVSYTERLLLDYNELDEHERVRINKNIFIDGEYGGEFHDHWNDEEKLFYQRSDYPSNKEIRISVLIELLKNISDGSEEDEEDEEDKEENKLLAEKIKSLKKT